MQPPQRDSRYEALRLTGIFLIILTHASAFGIRNVIMSLSPSDMTPSVVINYLLNYPGTIFNLIFVMLTGYFCIDSGISYKRILLLAIKTCCYAWIIAGIFCITGLQPLSRELLVSVAFPLFTGWNWFINCYLVFSLFLPILNKGLLALSAAEHRQLLLLLFLLRCLTSMFGMELYVTAGKDLELFLFLYAIGAYLKRYGLPQKRRSVWLLYALLISAAYSLSVIALCLLFQKTGKQWFLDHVTVFLEAAKTLSAVCILQSVCLRPSLFSGPVNKAARLVPGIYLLHENKLIRPYLWTRLWPLLPCLNTIWFVPAMLVKSVVVMLACGLLDLPWTCLVEPRLRLWVDRNWDHWKHTLPF